MGDDQVVAREHLMVRIVAAKCATCGQIPLTQRTPQGLEPFGTPVPVRWLEQRVRAFGITHGPTGCGPVQIEMEPWRD